MKRACLLLMLAGMSGWALPASAERFVYSQSGSLDDSEGAFTILGPWRFPGYVAGHLSLNDDSVVERLGLSRAPQAIPLLIRAARQPDQLVRYRAYDGLAAFQTPEALAALVGGLADEDLDAACHAAELLGQLRHRPAVPGLIRLGDRLLPQVLENPRDGKLDCVMDALAEIGDGQARPFLWKLFQADWGDQRSNVPSTAALSLARLKDPRLGDELMRRHQQGEWFLGYTMAMRHLGDKRLNAKLLAYLDASEFDELAQFAETCLLLGQTKDSSAIGALRHAQESWQRRSPKEVSYGHGAMRVLWPHQYAAYALAQLGDPLGEQTLLADFRRGIGNDNETLFRHHAAAYWLYLLGHDELVDSWLEQAVPIHSRKRFDGGGPLPDITREIRLLFGQRLFQAQGDRAAARLVAMANDHNVNVREPLKRLLLALSPDAVVPLLENKVRQEPQWGKDSYAEYLMFVGAPARAALERLARDGDFWTRAAGTLALMGVPGGDGREAAQAFSRDFASLAAQNDGIDSPDWTIGSTWKWVAKKAAFHQQAGEP